MTPAGARAALYTRVSTEDQAKEGFSLSAQLEKLRAYAGIHGWVIAGEYVEEGHSGRTTKRPAYQRMMAERDNWDVLLILKMDRIHRNSRNFMGMMDDLKEHGKQFASVMESLDTNTAMGRFVMDIIQRIGQLESEQTGERVDVGMREKAMTKKGGNGGPAPFGYRWEGGKLHVVPEEAKVVRFIFSLAEKNTTWEIARLLNEKGYTTRNGKQWTYWNVRPLMENVVYEGHLHWDGILQRNAHEPLKVKA